MGRENPAMSTKRTITPTEKIRGRNVEIVQDDSEFAAYVEFGAKDLRTTQALTPVGDYPVFYFDDRYLGLSSFESEAEARQGVRTLLGKTDSHRLWCDDNGRVACYDHGGHYLQSHVDYHYNDSGFDTPLTNWMDFTGFGVECEDCTIKEARRG